MPTLIAVAALAFSGLAQQELPAVTSAHGAFGFPNPQGTEIIVLHELPHPAELRTAICDGRVVPIRFARRQTTNGPEPGRQSPSEFNRLSGTVFRVTDRSARAEDACFLPASGLLSVAKLLRAIALPTPVPCTTAERLRIAALRDRQVRACWKIAIVPPHGIVTAVEYVRVARNALASLIVQTGGRDISIDFPAEFRGDDQELWRAGDGGEFSPYGFRFPAIIRRGTTYFVALDWDGEEGSALSFFEARPNTPTRQLLSDYWYRAPR